MEKFRVYNKDWLFSDSHFGHLNIMKLQNRPKNHESMMLANWIDKVADDDVLLHLGDVVSFKKGEGALNWMKVISRMPGKKYLIEGNHDKKLKELIEIAGFTLIDPFIQNRIAFTHRPITDNFLTFPYDQWDINVHGHIHGNPIQLNYDGAQNHGKRYFNICVEVCNYSPVQFGNLRI